MNNVINIFVIIFITILLILLGIFFLSRIFNNKERFDTNNKPSKVILQGFDQFFVSTKSWMGLETEVPEISKYFTAVLLPPFSQSADKVGYLPKNLFDFNSDWGNEESLKSLICALNNHNVDPIADLIIQHREGGSSWFQYDNPTFLNDEKVTPDMYYQYIDTTIYHPWGLGDNDAPKNVFYKDGLPLDYNTNGLKNCYTKDDKGNWSLYKDCRNKRPMYGIAGNANPSWLQGVNLCNINVLKGYMMYVKKLKDMGIKGIRFDEADAISSSFISLFLNSDKTKTSSLLKDIVNICNKAKSPEVDKDVLYTFENDISKTSVDELTSVPFDYKVVENFYGYLYGVNDRDKGWRGLVEMIDNVNKPLNQSDWSGEFDYTLKFMLNEMFNTMDLSINGQYFKKENMLIGTSKYKSQIVTFTDNHDTNYLITLYNDISDTVKGMPKLEINFFRILTACFVILLLPGIPMISKTTWDIYKNIGLQDLIKLRNELGITSDCEFEIVNAELDNISWKIWNLNTSIKGKYDGEVLKKKPKNGNVLLAEINRLQPIETNIFSREIFNARFFIKVSII
jgi:glycosidase